MFRSIDILGDAAAKEVAKAPEISCLLYMRNQPQYLIQQIFHIIVLATSNRIDDPQLNRTGSRNEPICYMARHT